MGSEERSGGDAAISLNTSPIQKRAAVISRAGLPSSARLRTCAPSGAPAACPRPEGHRTATVRRSARTAGDRRTASLVMACQRPEGRSGPSGRRAPPVEPRCACRERPVKLSLGGASHPASGGCRARSRPGGHSSSARYQEQTTGATMEIAGPSAGGRPDLRPLRLSRAAHLSWRRGIGLGISCALMAHLLADLAS